MLRALLKVLVHLEPVWEHTYDVDGHFSPYGGHQPVAKGWNAKRRLAEPGHTDVYVHDATGRALFYLNRPLNDSLVKVLPDIVAEIRAAVSDQPILVIFDRGGYSGAAFRALTTQGIGFITYLKGGKARRRFPADRFVRRWWEVDDPAGIGERQRHVSRVYERGTRIRGTGLVRTLVLEDGDAQIPVLTNCDEMPVAKAVHLLRLRLPGALSPLPNGTICVELHAPDQPRIRRALEAFLEDLNRGTPRMCGTGPALHFRVRDTRAALNSD